MIYGYAGKILRVNLTEGTFKDEELSQEVYQTWIGGVGLGVKYLFDEVPPEAGFDDPRNKVIIASGPLGGTKVCGSGTFNLVTKGALTGGVASSQANGFMGAYLKFCGYDGVIFEGVSPKWVYLYIDDNGPSLRDASHLVGLDTWELQQKITEESGDNKKLSIYGIGPAGENLVRFSSFVGDIGHLCAHNGVGAAVGFKKLKAMAVVKGSKAVAVFNDENVKEATKKNAYESRNIFPGVQTVKFGTAGGVPGTHSIGALPVRNYTTNIFPENEAFSGPNLRERVEHKKLTCWACSWAHGCWIKIKDGKYAGFEGEEPEYEGMAGMGSQIGQTDPMTTVYLANVVDRLGMDINESSWVIGWVMECYEKGYLKKEDLDGLEVKWGDDDVVKILLEKIAHREGIGNLLADGVKRASEKVGGEAVKCGVYTMKGNTPRGHDHRANWTELFDTCFSGTGTIEAAGGVVPATQHGLSKMSNNFDWEQVVNQIAKTNGRRIFEDSLGTCRFPAEFIDLTIQSVNNSTGWNLDLDQLMTTGRRIVNLMRVYNFRCGITGELDAPSERYGSTPIDGPAQGKGSRENWPKIKQRYYELMGWDTNGYPLPSTLEVLGLGKLASENSAK